jgi:nicotinamidase/pyrazinamidase
MRNINNRAFGIVDVQRGFMPVAPEDLGLAGFGELPVPQGGLVVPVINRLTKAARIGGAAVFTTRDWHPTVTAHFTTGGGLWPVHCVADTPGADFHPDLDIENVPDFKKGQEPLEQGDEDLSYSGFFGTDFSGRHLPDWLNRSEISTVFLSGLAFDYCVGATALDLLKKSGLVVTVIEDATRSVAPESAKIMRDDLLAAGIRLINSEQAERELIGKQLP